LGSGSSSNNEETNHTTSVTSGERTLAALDVDIVVDMNLPSYNRETGIIEWGDNGLSIRIENAVSETSSHYFVMPSQTWRQNSLINSSRGVY
jgi:hypothetical protein